MNTPTRVLVVGADTAEVTVLGAYVRTLFHGRCDLLAIEIDTTSVDPALAWGTEGPRVVALDPIDATPTPTPGEEQPLAEDGDSWKAIAAAAKRHHVHLIALVNIRQSWYSRWLSGSAARDVAAHAQHPVLLVPRDTLDAAQPTAPR